MALTLLVEGKLDAVLLRPALRGLELVVERGGTKSALPHEARRRKPAVFIRDRDFDAEPVEDRGHPVVHTEEAGRPLGWTWTRHEIESYLLEPALFAEVFDVAVEEWTQALTAAAAQIRGYQAARWAVGEARRQLPPTYKLDTYPDGCKGDFKLPGDLGAKAQEAWLTAHVGRFRQRVEPVLSDEALGAAFEARSALFDGDLVADVSQVLMWFSGKDLFGACRRWFEARGLGPPSRVRDRIRDFVIDSPEVVDAHLPEWLALRATLARLV